MRFPIAVSNSLSADFKAMWSKRQQTIFLKLDVFRQIANFEEQANLKSGDTVHRPYRSTLQVQSYTRGTAVTIRDITDTDESMVVQTAKVVPFYVDDLDELQSNYKIANSYADDAAQQLNNWIDGAVLAEVANAASVVDDADFGGTAADGFVLSTSNIQNVFSLAKMRLRKKLVKFQGNGDLFAVIPPEAEQVLYNYLAGKETALGDSTSLGGHIGRYYGFDIYVSNSCYWTASLAYNATTPTDTDTVTINGVVFTFKTTIGVTAGNVLAVTDGVTSLTNLKNFINAPSTTSANQVALSQANQDLLIGITAAVTATATGALTLTGSGTGVVQVSETLTPAADIWTTNSQIVHGMFGKKGAVDVIIQSEPKLETREVPDKLGMNFLPYTLFGKKTFVEGTKMLVDVKFRSSSY